MANEVEILKMLKEAFDSGALSAKDFTNFINGATVGGVKLSHAINQAGAATKGFTAELGKVESTKFNFIIGLAKDQLQNMRKELEEVRKQLGDMSSTEMVAAIAKFGMLVGVASGLSKIPSQLENIGSAARDAGIGAANAGDALKRLQEIKPGLANNAVFAILQNMTRQADAAKNLQNKMIMNAAAAGELGRVTNKTGDAFERLESQSIAFTDTAYNVAQATGLTTGEVSKYADELSKIPGAMTSVINITTSEQRSMQLLEAAIKVASGTGQSMNDVLGDMKTLFMNVGMNGADAIDSIARMSSASSATRLPLNTVREYTKSAADQFRVFGNNTNAAINILTQFGVALKGKMGPEAIKEVTAAFTSGIKNLDIAQKAFIGMQTGAGHGLLSGAFKIDLELQKGNLDKVAGRVRESMMREFGGRIVSLEEASKNENAASQMALQVQMLRQGPLGALAQTTEQAYAILNMFTKSSEMTAEDLKNLGDPEAAMKKALNRGEKLQESQVNVLNQILNKADKLTGYAAIQAYHTMKGLAGKEGVIPEIQDMLNNVGINAGQLGLGEMFAGGQEAAAIAGEQKPGKETNINLNDIINTFAVNAEDTRKFLGNLFSNIGIKPEEKTAQTAYLPANENVKNENEPNLLYRLFSLVDQSEPPRPREHVAQTMNTIPQEEMTPWQTMMGKNQESQVPIPVKLNVTTTCDKCHRQTVQDEIMKDGEKRVIANHTGAH